MVLMLPLSRLVGHRFLASLCDFSLPLCADVILLTSSVHEWSSLFVCVRVRVHSRGCLFIRLLTGNL